MSGVRRAEEIKNAHKFLIGQLEETTTRLYNIKMKLQKNGVG